MVEKDGRSVERKSVERDEWNETEKGAFGPMGGWKQVVEGLGTLIVAQHPPPV